VVLDREASYEPTHRHKEECALGYSENSNKLGGRRTKESPKEKVSANQDMWEGGVGENV